MEDSLWEQPLGELSLNWEASQNPLHVSLAFDDELSDQQKGTWSGNGARKGHHPPSTSSPAARPGELSLNWDPVANSESVRRARESSLWPDGRYISS